MATEHSAKADPDERFVLRIAEMQASIALMTLAETYRRMGMEDEAQRCGDFATDISAAGHRRMMRIGQGKQ